MWQGEPAYVKTASALQLRPPLPHSPSTASGPPPSQREADKAAPLRYLPEGGRQSCGTVASPFGRGGGVADGEGKRQRTPSSHQPACQSPASKTPRCGVLRVEPDPREGVGYVGHDEISRGNNASKVVRPGFRMGLKPTALLRRAAKVRLTCGSLRMTRDGMLQSVFLLSPLSVPKSRGEVASLWEGGGPLAVEGECGRKRSEDATPKRFLHTPAPPFNSPLPEGGYIVRSLVTVS